MGHATVQSLWIGPRLSTMERLSIRSFLEQGHEVHLFVYEPVEGVPQGTVVCPGEEVVPAGEIFRYRTRRGRGSPSAFSNYFRYKLLLERGGWWSDLDMVCLRPLVFTEEHVLGHERSPGGGTLVGTGIMKAPSGSALMEYCWRASREADRSRLVWGEIGPRLITRAIDSVAVPARMLAPEAFFPIDFWQVWRFVVDRQLPDGGDAIHLWNSEWRLQWLDPDAAYDPACIYEQLKRRYGVSSPPDATRGPSRKAAALSRLRLLRRLMRSGRSGGDR